MRSRSVIAIRHLAFEDLGSLAQILIDDGYDIRYLEAGVDDLVTADTREADLLITLGGPIGANDESAYPFLVDEIALLTERMQARRPTFGICLGAQLMARAMGAEVRPAARKEIGWAPLSLTSAGRASSLLSLASTPVLHWHGDMFAIPDGAERLAATPDCPNQAFAVGSTQLAVQFHPEVTVSGMERWYIGHANELNVCNVSVSGLRADSERFGAALETRGARAFRRWLSGATGTIASTMPDIF